MPVLFVLAFLAVWGAVPQLERVAPVLVLLGGVVAGVCRAWWRLPPYVFGVQRTEAGR